MAIVPFYIAASSQPSGIVSERSLGTHPMAPDVGCALIARYLSEGDPDRFSKPIGVLPLMPPRTLCPSQHIIQGAEK
jgi:hypothetical protein